MLLLTLAVALSSLAPALTAAAPTLVVSRLAPALAIPGAAFGSSAAMDGATAVIGAPAESTAGSSAGAAYVFRFDGSAWVQEARLIGDDTNAFDRFGTAVAIHGDTIVVGAYGDAAGGSNAGSAYVFRRGAGGWAQEAKLLAADASALKRFGWSVAVSDGVAVVGAYGDAAGGSNAGAAYVFRRGAGGWAQEAKLLAADAGGFEFFGYAVAIDGGMIAVGAPLASDFGGNAGLVYTFTGSGGVWTQDARLVPSDVAAGDRFGSAVALAGSRLVVGSPLNDGAGLDAGAVYVFSQSGGTWEADARLRSSSAVAALGQFGWSVAADGEHILVGAYGDATLGLNAGAAFLFSHSSVGWSEQQRLDAAAPALNARFGSSVALSGALMVVGAMGDAGGGPNTGATYAYYQGESPTFTSIPLTDATLGQMYHYQAVAIAEPAPRYSLDSAPAGMTIDSLTGAIEWMPGAVGSYSVIVRASNGLGSDALQSFTIVVEEVTYGRLVDPILECVSDRGGGIYIALFGYNNPNSGVVNLPIGDGNAFNRYAADLGQPTTFLPGRYANVFATVFDGNDLAWELNYRTVVASALSSPRCADAGVSLAPVRPVLECIADNGDKSYTAYFGYRNDNGFSIAVPLPRSRYFHDHIVWDKPVFVFQPGRHKSVFELHFSSDNWSWVINDTDQISLDTFSLWC